MTELPAPPEAASAADATELLRTWLIGETLQCSLSADVFEDPASWGAVLADLARHVARASSPDACAAAALLRQLRETFVSELTDAPGGDA